MIYHREEHIPGDGKRVWEHNGGELTIIQSPELRGQEVERGPSL